jgi:transposase-like protein
MEHIDGVPFRKLGNEQGLSGKQTYLRVARELQQLPNNTKLTQELCDMRRYSGILILDGKYIKVKGYRKAIPLLWGLDYLTHDPVIGKLVPAEDTIAFRNIFFALKDMGYPLRAVVVDDRAGITEALKEAFPRAKVQLCHVHYLENIRKILKVRTDMYHQHFFNSLRLHVFLESKTIDEVLRWLKHLKDNRCEGNELRLAIVADVYTRIDPLFAYFDVPGCPNNTNLIELYNSHLNARVKSIKGFSGYQNASTWLNAYLIRRRTKPLTDCEETFKYLNGHASLELSIKKQAQWPEQLTDLGITQTKYFSPPEKPLNTN